MGFDKDYIDQFREMTPEEIENHIGLEKGQKCNGCLTSWAWNWKNKKAHKGNQTWNKQSQKKYTIILIINLLLKFCFVFWPCPSCPSYRALKSLWMNILWNVLMNLGKSMFFFEMIFGKFCHKNIPKEKWS